MNATSKQLTLENLPEFGDGTAAAAFNTYVNDITEDCAIRWGVTTARTVTLTVTMTPKPMSEGGRAEVFVVCKRGIPPVQTITHDVGIRRVKDAKGRQTAMATFQPDAPEDSDQLTIMGDRDK